jgi:hypothetical protein
MALTRIGGANAISGTIPQGNIANASLGAVTALPAAITTGKVLQVKYMKSSAGSGLSGTSLIDTPLTNTITPSSTSSKILIQFQLQAKLEFQNTEGYGTAVKRTISGSDTTLFEQVAYQNHTGNNTGNIETGTISYYCFEDSPNTISQITYTVQVKGENTQPIQIPNGGENTFTLFEVSA